MLAYVFWHWKQESVPIDEYEAAQRAFHAALAAAPPPGFLGSRSFALAGYPWAAMGAAAYEDWYHVTDSAGLDPLNQAAVTASREAPHHAAARLAEGGTAGLYRLKLPPEPPSTAFDRPRPPSTHASWFAKPAGLSYPALWSLLGRVVEDQKATLWIRHMTLGPSPEFCLQSPGPLHLPPPIAPLGVTLRSVWP
ncbi:MAG TPA: hypothetical protein VGA78_14410 [Gemmatimonadales bacterium]